MRIASIDPNVNRNGKFNVFTLHSIKALATGQTSVQVFEGQQQAQDVVCNLQTGMMPDGNSFKAYFAKIFIAPPAGTPWTLAARQAADDLLSRSMLEYKLQREIISQLHLALCETNRPNIADSGTPNSLLGFTNSGTPDQMLDLTIAPHEWPMKTPVQYEVIFAFGVPAALNNFTIGILFLGELNTINAANVVS